jgi:hypothetical protein
MNNHDEPKSLLKSLLENMWLLLILGVGFYFLSYIAWGWIEIAMTRPVPSEIIDLYK